MGPCLMTGGIQQQQRETGIAVAKGCNQVESSFMTALLSDSNSGPNCHCNLRTTCVVKTLF